MSKEEVYRPCDERFVVKAQNSKAGNLSFFSGCHFSSPPLGIMNSLTGVKNSHPPSRGERRLNTQVCEERASSRCCAIQNRSSE